MASGRLSFNRYSPVKNRLPTLAPLGSNFFAANVREESKDRNAELKASSQQSTRLLPECLTAVIKECVPSIRVSNSFSAVSKEYSLGKRCFINANNSLCPPVSESERSIRRLRKSPIPGIFLNKSLIAPVLPPSSAV